MEKDFMNLATVARILHEKYTESPKWHHDIVKKYVFCFANQGDFESVNVPHIYSKLHVILLENTNLTYKANLEAK